jgi:cytochrome c oxidase subunit 4
MAHHDSNDGRIAHAHDPRYGINVIIWITLLSLTVITVAVAGIDLGNYTLFVAMLIAAIKSTFVINYFMHIKFEDLIFKIFLILVILVLAVIFVLTAFDVFLR